MVEWGGKGLFRRELFPTLQVFSLALDTALFGQEHVMSCTVRFIFESDVMQFPLFMALCYATSGEEMASFLSSKLRVEGLISQAGVGDNRVREQHDWKWTGTLLLFPLLVERGRVSRNGNDRLAQKRLVLCS